ncbi:hypothetical protein EV647_4097 [Kribbella sp. VKM Ac-2566]|nr:hypothetical protein EV647_4097 [Kribbella sp. VKM Ac-2566]
MMGWGSGHRERMISAAWRLLAGTAVLGLAFVASAPAVAHAQDTTVQVAVAPTPSPTLGSTNSSRPQPPGASDSSPSDYDGAIWVVVAVVVVVALVGGGTLYLMRTRRIDLTQRTTPDEERDAEAERRDHQQ